MLLITLATIHAIVMSNGAILFIMLATLIVGWGLIQKNGNDVDNTHILFLSTYSLYYLYAMYVRYVVIQDPSIDYFIDQDHLKYLKWTTIYSEMSWGKIIPEIYNEWQVQSFPVLMIVLSFIKKVCDMFGAGDVTVLLMAFSFCASIIMVLLYEILKKVMADSQALVAVYVFMVCSHFLSFTPLILREFMLTIGFCIAFKLILTSEKKYRWVILLLAFEYIVWGLRWESGVFYLGIIGYYLYLMFQTKIVLDRYYRIILYVLMAFAMVGVYTVSQGTVQEMNESMEFYSEYAQKGRADGVGVKLHRLPPGVKHLALTAWGQIMPFPLWNNMNFDDVDKTPWIKFPFGIATLFWFVCWFYILKAVLLFQKRVLALNKELLVSFGISFVYIVAISSNYNQHRRMLCVYPMIYVFTAVIFAKMSTTERKRTAFQAVGSYCSLVLMFYMLKI